MQIEIKRLHRELGTTILYVTHDQDEAMAMSDRIAVMNDGRLTYRTPRELYARPATTSSRLCRRVHCWRPSRCNWRSVRPSLGIVGAAQWPRRRSSRVTVSLRPVHLVVVAGGGDAGVPGSIEEVLFRGDTVIWIVDIEGAWLIAKWPPAAPSSQAWARRAGSR